MLEIIYPKSLLLYVLSCCSMILSFSSFSQEVQEIDSSKVYSWDEALRVDPNNVFHISAKKKKWATIPEEIRGFKNLTSLDVSKNKLRKFPVILYEIHSLQELNISRNGIEVVPDSIAKMRYIKKLDLSDNEIETLPASFGLMSQLEYLDVWGNHIGALPADFGNIKETLKILDMRVILMSKEEQKAIKELLPLSKIYFSKTCNCGY